MAREYDSQLLESVAVRRRRLRDGVLFGRARTRRSLDEGLGRFLGGTALAAVVCAGCVGWSFVSERMGERGGYSTPRVHGAGSGASVTPSVNGTVVSGR
ncbi:hypothetical protein [Streptomyces sp. AJS327]|uniref:hypothetical protein n=1 Tax=Streptomyces sp. AJS327 TaxID=2545265 RepID=UPI002155D0CD|nr:hypothetical protein [Streptomyces sp. AJS327]